MVLKFHNDPKVKKSAIIVLLAQVSLYARKREGFETGTRENEFKKKRKPRDVS